MKASAELLVKLCKNESLTIEEQKRLMACYQLLYQDMDDHRKLAVKQAEEYFAKNQMNEYQHFVQVILNINEFLSNIVYILEEANIEDLNKSFEETHEDTHNIIDFVKK